MNEYGRDFSEWLRAQLETRRISQRQLAFRSGVNHSTISRLLRGDRIPSLRTATKLTSSLREWREGHPLRNDPWAAEQQAAEQIAHVARALRADDMLGEWEARQVMEYYAALRTGRLAVRGQPSPKTGTVKSARSARPLSSADSQRRV
jgi:transcriptional regulator with XRE-family HTH domain